MFLTANAHSDSNLVFNGIALSAFFLLVFFSLSILLYSQTKSYSDTRYIFLYFLLVGAGHYILFM